MANFILTQNSTPVIGWCASLLGKVMEWIYVFFNNVGIANIGLCIIVFTLIIKVCMFPLAIKQQKFSKLSSLMNPELQAIQKKYQGKRDNESMMKMQEETSAVYQKYGTSPTGSCVQMLIQMPILFSLYYIVSCVPAYVPQVKEYYQDVSEHIVVDYDYFKYMNKAYDKYVLEKGDKDEYSYIDSMLGSITDSSSNNKVIDALVKYDDKKWHDLELSYYNFGIFCEQLTVVTDEEWDELLSGIKNEKERNSIQEFVDTVIKNYVELDKLEDQYNDKYYTITESSSKILEINEFGPINLSQYPMTVKGWALLIPILCFLTQWFSSKMVMSNNGESMEDNPMANSMKTMNIVLPAMSAFIAFSVPAGLGLYWVFNGIFQIIQQVVMNAYFKRIDVEDIIKANVEKMNKKKEKMGIDPTKVSSFANTSTKSISSKTNVNQSNKDTNTSNAKYKAGSMAEKANMVKSYNEKNRK